MGGSFFFEKHHLAQPLYDLGEKVHPKHYAFCALCILLCFIVSYDCFLIIPCFQMIRIN